MNRGGTWSYVLYPAPLSAFGICSNTDVLQRIRLDVSKQWSDLAKPRLSGALALADPTQSGSAGKAFEMLIQQQIVEAGGDPAEGWKRAMRLPILPELYAPEFERFRSDPGVDPFVWARENPPYHPEWTASLFGTIAFVIQAMAIDPQEELREAWAEIITAGFPPQATALFDDVSAVDYATATSVLKPALASAQKMDQTRLGKRLGDQFREQYGRVAALAREGK